MKSVERSHVGLGQFMRLRARYKALVIAPFVSGILLAVLIAYPVGRVIAAAAVVNPNVSLNSQPSGLLVAVAFLALFCAVMVAVFVGGFSLLARHIRRTHSPQAARSFTSGSAFPESWYA